MDETVDEAVGDGSAAQVGGTVRTVQARATADAETVRREDEDMAVPPRLKWMSRQSSQTIRHMSNTERYFTRWGDVGVRG
ncbi:hypothetical protein GCM10009639_49490 [Kitasatospora putterlickiae]|uniref:Uncharacterized protein n=1 Tax=Kitasatospora putterlickiae TaxID=221725 RepID=A0ABP4J0S4_9ACTN